MESNIDFIKRKIKENNTVVSRCEPFVGFCGSDDTDRFGCYGYINNGRRPPDYGLIFYCSKHGSYNTVHADSILDIEKFYNECCDNLDCVSSSRRECESLITAMSKKNFKEQ